MKCDTKVVWEHFRERATSAEKGVRKYGQGRYPRVDEMRAKSGCHQADNGRHDTTCTVTCVDVKPSKAGETQEHAALAVHVGGQGVCVCEGDDKIKNWITDRLAGAR